MIHFLSYFRIDENNQVKKIIYNENKKQKKNIIKILLGKEYKSKCLYVADRIIPENKMCASRLCV